MDIGTLLDQARDPNQSNAFLANLMLIMLQRSGRAMRLYPDGRKGPLDEGFVPFVLYADLQLKLITVQTGRDASISIAKDEIGPRLLQIRELADAALEHYRRVCPLDPYWSIDRAITPDVTMYASVEDDRFVIKLGPKGLLTWHFGPRQAVQLVRDCMMLMSERDWDFDDCGLTYDQAFQLGEFVDGAAVIVD